jgi:hypothetical protein
MQISENRYQISDIRYEGGRRLSVDTTQLASLRKTAGSGDPDRAAARQF